MSFFSSSLPWPHFPLCIPLSISLEMFQDEVGTSSALTDNSVSGTRRGWGRGGDRAWFNKVMSRLVDVLYPKGFPSERETVMAVHSLVQGQLQWPVEASKPAKL